MSLRCVIFCVGVCASLMERLSVSTYLDSIELCVHRPYLSATEGPLNPASHGQSMTVDRTFGCEQNSIKAL